MKVIALSAVLAILTSLTAAADFAEDFQAAKKLLNAKEHQAAYEAFVKLAETAPDERGRAPSLSYAAIALARLDRYDEALELAKSISPAPMAAYTQMAIMTEHRKRKELATAFKDEDIAAWPDEINYKGFFMRGAVRSLSGDRQGALADFEQCVALAGSDMWMKVEAMERVASLHHLLGNDAKAMAAYRNALAWYEESPGRKGRWLFPKTLLGAVHILIEQKKHDEARKLLDSYADTSGEIRRNSWGFLVLEAYGDIYAGQGNKTEALAKYRDALEIQTHQGYMDRVAEKVEKLQMEKKPQ